MSDNEINNSENLFNKVFKKISKANLIVDEYKRLGITPAMPGNAFINMANSMYTMGHFKEAEDLLQSAICFPTKTSNALINLGIIKQTTGDFEEAMKFYSSAYEQDNSNSKALGLWGNCLAMTGRKDEAIQKYKQAINIDYKNADVYLSWGALLIKTKNYNEAKEKLHEAAKYNTKDVRPLYMIAIVEIELGEYNEALEKLLNIINITENNFEALHNIAYIYFKQKNYDEAISYAKKVLAIYRHKIETYLLLGDIYAIKNQEKDSLQFYEMAEMNDLKTFFLYISWGVSLQKFGKHEQAIKKFHTANEYLKTKNIDEVYSRLALSYLKIGDLDMAEKNKDKALEINPQNYMANSVAAEIELDKQNYQLSLEYLEKCKDDFSNKGFNYSLKAQCYLGLGKLENVQTLFEKALEYMPEKKEIIIAYTKFLISQGTYELAKKRIKKYLETSDDIDVLNLYFIVLYNLAKQENYRYNLDAAVKVAKQIMQKNSDMFVYKSEFTELEEIIKK